MRRFAPLAALLLAALVAALPARAEKDEKSKAPEHKTWGMYEFALNGPDDLLVRIGRPSR